MMQLLRDNPWVFGALTGSLATYLLQLVIGHVRREKRWIGYSISRHTIARGGSRLAITYAGRSVERLDSCVLTLSNIGNRALRRLPVTIRAPDGEILEREVRGPDGATLDVQSPRSSDLAISCDLLNPGENYTLSLTLADSKEPVQVIARAEYLRVKAMGTTGDVLLMMPVELHGFMRWYAAVWRRLTKANS